MHTEDNFIEGAKHFTDQLKQLCTNTVFKNCLNYLSPLCSLIYQYQSNLFIVPPLLEPLTWNFPTTQCAPKLANRQQAREQKGNEIV